ncbi:MAG: ABC transporter permease, partial [Acidobacteriota bacterium]
KTLVDLAALQLPGKTTLAPPGGEAFEIVGENVSASYFRVLGIRLRAGADFGDAEEKVGAAPVAIISQRLWQSRFNASDDVIGRVVLAGDRPTRIIGVAPAEFKGMVAETTTDLWVNLTSTPSPEQLTRRGYNFLQIFGRLQPGATLAQADAAARAIFDSGQEEELLSLPPARRAMERRRLSVVPGDTGMSGLRQLFGLPLRIIMGVVAMLLLISCANIANLLLARMAARRREVATRISLGAGAARLVRQFLTESAILALAGGVAGVALAWWGDAVLLRLLPNRGTPVTLDVHPDWRVLLFTAAISLGSVLLFGLAPALRVLRPDVAAGLKQTTGGDAATHTRLRPGKMLAAAQVALSIVLVFAAGLFLRTLTNLRNVPAGFRPDHVVTFRLAIPPGYAGVAQSALTQRVVEAVRALPRVRAASVSSGMWGGGGIDLDIQIVGKPPVSYGKQRPMVVVTGPGFLSVIRTPLVAGRDFDDRDREGAPVVAMVNQAFARARFGGEDPIGQKLTTRVLDGKVATVVGVVHDVRHWGLREPAVPAVYFPTNQLSRLWMPEFIMRTDSPPGELLPMIRRATSTVDGRLRPVRMQTLDKTMDDYLERERLLASLSSLFGFIALTLASVGIFGVISHGVTRRMNEIGLRMALGANPPQVLRMILRDAATIPLAGIAIGAPVAFAASRVAESLLFGVEHGDPALLVISGALIVAMAMLAAAIAARRAMKLDPLSILRHE